MNWSICLNWFISLVFCIWIIKDALKYKKEISKISVEKENCVKIIKELEDISYLKKHRDQGGEYFENYIRVLNNRINNDKEKNDLNKNAIIEHLKIIYDAGIYRKNLNVDLLVKKTMDKILKRANTLKAGISLILLIGIAGTLVELLISIWEVSSFNGINNGIAINGLNGLFDSLKLAFLPSFFGVIVTRKLILNYNEEVQENVVDKLSNLLVEKTVNNWIPTLIREDELEIFLKKASAVNEETITLEKNLKKGNNIISQLNKVTRTLDNTINKFDSSTNKILDLKNLYEEILQSNSAFKESLKKVVYADINERKESKEILEKNIAEQRVYLNKIIEEIKQYNELFNKKSDSLIENIKNIAIEERKETQKIIQKYIDDNNSNLNNIIEKVKDNNNGIIKNNSDLIKEIQETVKSINESNKINIDVKNIIDEYVKTVVNKQEEMKNAITEPINETLNKVNINLNTNLSSINDRMQNNLDGIVKNIVKLEQPIEKMTEVTESMSNVTKTMTDTTVKYMQKSIETLNKLNNSIERNNKK